MSDRQELLKERIVRIQAQGEILRLQYEATVKELESLNAQEMPIEKTE